MTTETTDAFSRVYASQQPPVDAVLELACQDARHAGHTEWANKISDARSAFDQLVEAGLRLRFAMRYGAVFERDNAAQQFFAALVRVQGTA